MGLAAVDRRERPAPIDYVNVPADNAAYDRGPVMTTQAAWRSKPSYYPVSTQDRIINPNLERFMAKRMGAKTIEIEASHLSLISHPDAISQLVLDAAVHDA